MGAGVTVDYGSTTLSRHALRIIGPALSLPFLSPQRVIISPHKTKTAPRLPSLITRLSNPEPFVFLPIEQYRLVMASLLKAQGAATTLDASCLYLNRLTISQEPPSIPPKNASQTGQAPSGLEILAYFHFQCLDPSPRHLFLNPWAVDRHDDPAGAKGHKVHS